MAHTIQDGTVRPKKPYKKPEVKAVALRPEEAVLGFCKKNLVNGPLQSGCNNPANCSSQGS